MIQMETDNYLTRWNKKSSVENVHNAMAELIIMTASRCLLGEEVRSKLDETCNMKYYYYIIIILLYYYLIYQRGNIFVIFL
jgi:sterol 14-demethylase